MYMGGVLINESKNSYPTIPRRTIMDRSKHKINKKKIKNQYPRRSSWRLEEDIRGYIVEINK